MKKILVVFLIGISMFSFGCKSSSDRIPEESNTQQINPAQGVSPDPNEIPEDKNSKEEHGKIRIKGLYEKLVKEAENNKSFNEKDWSNFKGTYMNELKKAENELSGVESVKNIPILKDLISEYDKYLNGNSNDEKIKELKVKIENNIN